MNYRRFRQVLMYGWQDANVISQEINNIKSRFAVFHDILYCFIKYNVWSNQYKKEKLYLLTSDQKKEICLKYQEKNTKRDHWVKEFFDNYKFLNKWSSFKYETSPNLQAKRRTAYKKQYGLGENCFVGYDVIFHKHHYVDSKIETGVNCGFSEHVDVDFTGGLKLGNKVWLSEGVKVFTHNHVVDFSANDETKGCIKTPLCIHDRVWVGSRAIIMPGVSEIGRGALISSCSYVRNKVPPYAIVMGNPAKIIGFRFPPEEIVKFEEENFPPDQRIPVEVLQKNYEKYYKSQWKEVNNWVKSLSFSSNNK